MKRRINNLHKGMFKGNKTSNIIELHSKKRYDKSKENQNINISQYKYDNNDNDISKNNKSKNIGHKKNRNKSPNKKEKEKISNIYNDTFSDSDSSHNKSIIKTKLYNKYAKSGTYFKKLRQQVIDKFISGKPLISIERMYNNPEVKKMFGVQNNIEKTNYQCSTSFKNDEEDMISPKEERDRRIPPSKFIPIPNIYNNINMQYNDGFSNNININNINDKEQSNNFNNNTMNKINQNYYHYKMQNQIQNPNNINTFQNNNRYNPYLYNQQQKYNNINNIKNNSLFMNTNDTNNSEMDMFEYDGIHDINKEFRKKRISNNDNKDNYMIELSGINEEINNEYNKEYNEKENINNLLNNLKNANNNNYNDYNIYSYENRDNDSYFNNLLIKKDKENNFVNYFKKNQGVIENSEVFNDIGFDSSSKK